MEQRKSLQRAHERQENKLLDQIAEATDKVMYLAGRTWNAPPRVEEPEVEEEAPNVDWAALG